MELWIIFTQCEYWECFLRKYIILIFDYSTVQEKISTNVKFAFGENICYNSKSLLKNKGE